MNGTESVRINGILLPSGEHAHPTIEYALLAGDRYSGGSAGNGNRNSDNKPPQSGELNEAYRLTVLVPTHDNGRQRFSPLRFRGFEQFLRSIPTGFSRRDGSIFGTWPDPQLKKW